MAAAAAVCRRHFTRVYVCAPVAPLDWGTNGPHGTIYSILLPQHISIEPIRMHETPFYFITINMACHFRAKGSSSVKSARSLVTQPINSRPFEVAVTACCLL